MLRVWQVAPRFDVEGPPNGLLRLAIRIARNLALSELRRLHGDPMQIEKLAATDDEPFTEASNPDPHLRTIIAKCREKLPARPAAALNARLQNAGNDPDRTLTQRMGMRLNTFLQNITRARRLLAQCLNKNGVDLDLELES